LLWKGVWVFSLQIRLEAIWLLSTSKLNLVFPQVLLVLLALLSFNLALFLLVGSHLSIRKSRFILHKRSRENCIRLLSIEISDQVTKHIATIASHLLRILGVTFKVIIVQIYKLLLSLLDDRVLSIEAKFKTSHPLLLGLVTACLSWCYLKVHLSLIKVYKLKSII
jgi:hypothetical protein